MFPNILPYWLWNLWHQLFGLSSTPEKFLLILLSIATLRLHTLNSLCEDHKFFIFSHKPFLIYIATTLAPWVWYLSMFIFRDQHLANYESFCNWYTALPFLSAWSHPALCHSFLIIFTGSGLIPQQLFFELRLYKTSRLHFPNPFSNHAFKKQKH